MTALTPSEARTFVNAAIPKQIPYVYGPPGIGKSDLFEQVAKDHKLKLIDIRLSQMLPEDLTGLPRFDEDNGKATYVPFDTFPMENDEVPSGYFGWLVFLDELSSASEEVMAAIYSLLLGHRIGGKRLHKRAVIVAAGNRSSDSAIARSLPDTLITRLLPCEMKVSAKDWLNWAVTKCSTARQEVVDFITKYPDMLYGSGKPSDRSELETYPTPRGWAKTFDIMAFNEKSIADADKAAGFVQGDVLPTTKHLLNAAVGTMATQAFVDFYKEAVQIPHAWEVAQSPSTTKIPPNPIARASLTEELVEYYEKNLTTSGDTILQYMNRLPSENKSLFAQLLAKNTADNQSGHAIMKKVRERLGVVSPPSGDPLGLARSIPASAPVMAPPSSPQGTSQPMPEPDVADAIPLDDVTKSRNLNSPPVLPFPPAVCCESSILPPTSDLTENEKLDGMFNE